MESTLMSDVRTSSHRWERILAGMQRLLAGGEYPGFGVLVYQHGEVMYEEVCGSMDLEAGKPLQKDTIIRLYSQTKPVACAALLMLFEEGKFLLDDPVSRYIPAFGKTKVYAGTNMGGMRLADPERPMTVRQLFTHTSGLSYGFMPDHPVDKLYGEAKLLNGIDYGLQPLGETIERLATIPLMFQPGSVFNYSMSHDVVGYLVSLLSDMPFEDFMKQRIFDPLGMDDTDFWVPPQKAERFAALYYTDENGKTALAAAPGTSKLLQPVVAALGGMGLVSTQRDYLRFARMLLNGGELDGARLLGRKTVDLMRSNHLNPAQLASMGTPENPNHGFGYGLGVGVMMDRALNGSMRSNGSFGWGGAAGTEAVIDPQEDLVVLTMTQRLAAPYAHNVLLQNLVYQALE
jgi:CubicO group peptidase (beta-lactamase class C family)